MRGLLSSKGMLALKRILAAGIMCAGLSLTPTLAQEMPHAPAQKWSFTSPFGSFDPAAAQRGFQIYSEVCANCHSMRYLHYRDLSGIGLNPEAIKAVAAAVTVPQGFDDQGVPKEGPATPASQFRSPFPNDIAARATNNGALPPDLSLIVNAREGEYDYIFALLNGYVDAPADFPMQEGMYYNKAYPGHQIAMPRPLSDGQITFADNSGNNTEQMARDLVTFLSWAANPEMVERKQMGVRIVLFLILLTGLSYAVKRRIWSDVH
jgi:ubiquinol-cytochrome c reductase cytochrome c1 subunit